MTITIDDYINRVLAAMPAATPQRSQIAMELRGHIAERMSGGASEDDVFRQLGDPVRLAGIYTIVAEYLAGETLGKRAMRLRVVRESGARIGLGQAIVRQLPMFLQVYIIDVLFALFTERRQRAFELLSKTRIVAAGKE